MNSVRFRSGAAIGALSLALASVLAGAGAAEAAAVGGVTVDPAWSERIIEGSHITVTSIEGPRMRDLPAGGMCVWEVGIETHPDAPDGDVTIAFSGTETAQSGDLALSGELFSCATPWDFGAEGPTRPGGAETVLAEQHFPFIDAPQISFASGEQQWLLFMVKRPSYGGTGLARQQVTVNFAGEAISVDPPITPAPNRIGGDDRYETAVGVSREAFPNGPVPVVYLATGQNFPDALTGGAAAYAAGGPLLLVRRDSIPAIVSEELSRLQPGRIVVLGGPHAVADAVYRQLTDSFGGVERIGGVDRYETAALVSREFSGPGGNAILTTGANFPDGMSAGSLFHSFLGPVLLTRGTELTAGLAAELARLAPTDVFILGGTDAVPAGVEAAVSAAGMVVTRLGGADRYATSAAIARYVFDAAGYSRDALAVNGNSYADGLVAGVLAGTLNAPVMLTRGTCWDPDSLDVHYRMGANVTLIGGPAVLHDSVATRAACAVPARTWWRW